MPCRLNESLAENKDLSARLVDQALQNEEDMFDAAFGDSQTPAARTPPRQSTPTAVENRQEELTQQVIFFWHLVPQMYMIEEQASRSLLLL